MNTVQLQDYIAAEWIADGTTSKDVNPSGHGRYAAELFATVKTSYARAGA